MRIALLCTTSLVALAACDPAVEVTHGMATTAALTVHASAVSVATSLAALPRLACRPPTPAGEVTVETQLEWVMKRDGGSSRGSESRRWRRDADGDLSSSVSLASVLPDGRSQTRGTEARVVAGRAYAAVDGRFASADRVPEVRARAASDGFGAVDDLLSSVGVDVDRLVAADPSHAPLCTPAELPPPGLSPIAGGAVSFGARGRSGWLRWRHAGTVVVVTFSERVERFADDVVAPEELWPVDPDRSYHEIDTLLTALVDAGLALRANPTNLRSP